jgi:predicted MFS family arabinose efflux permease
LMATSLVLVVAEFLPPSLLTPMAASLGVTEGRAGQAVTATALIGFVTGPTIGMLLPRLDRRTLLIGLALAAVVSNVVVSLATSLWLLLLARLLLGAAIGGFWAMSLAVAAQLATPRQLGRAMMLVNTGTTVATVAGVPFGVYAGSVLGWRVVFAGVAVVTFAVAVALRLVLAPMVPAAAAGLGSLAEAFRVPGMALGLTGHALTVFGHFAAFTYIRAALSRVPGLDAGGVAVMLALFGIGGFVGNMIVGLLVDRHLPATRYLAPWLIGLSLVVVALFPETRWLVGAAVAIWGFAFGAWLTVLSTWMGRLAPDRMEAGGGLMVAGFQLAITLGAGVGGFLLDHTGTQLTLIMAASSALVGGLLFGSAREQQEVLSGLVA